MAHGDGRGVPQEGAMIRTSLFTPQQAPDGQDAELDAGTDLLAAVGITQRMYKHATTRPLGNYFAGVVGNTQLFRASQTDLGPLSGIFASSHKPDFRPLDQHTMAAAFSLQPGTAVLAAERKGQAASEDLLGSAVMPSAPPQPSTAITAAAGDSKKEKRKRDKKDKKERKEEKKRKPLPTAI